MSSNFIRQATCGQQTAKPSLSLTDLGHWFSLEKSPMEQIADPTYKDIAQFNLPFAADKHRISSLREKALDELADTVYNIQSEVPPHNIIAMWETLQKDGKY